MSIDPVIYYYYFVMIDSAAPKEDTILIAAKEIAKLLSGKSNGKFLLLRSRAYRFANLLVADKAINTI